MNIVNVQFIKGINETVIPEIRLTRSRTGSTGTATFRFKNPSVLKIDISNKQLISGLYLIDQEGRLLTKTLDVKFLNGKPLIIEAIYVIKTTNEWERLTRFLTRYSDKNKLTFIKADKN